MAFTYGVTQTVQAQSGPVTKTNTYSGSAVAEFDESVSNGATDTQINIAIDVSTVKVFWIYSDVAITVETNDGSAPDDTLTLAAGIPYMYVNDGEDTFLLGTDVTALFITNASGSTANITCRCLQDSTP
jgi:hypothetical protein